MIKLLTFAIVAGLIYESHQRGNGSPKSGNPQNKGCLAGSLCYYPTHIPDSCEDDSETFQRLHTEHPEKICHSDVTIHFSCYPPFCGGVCWSDWVKTGRFENSVSATYNFYECAQPLYIEAVTVDTMIPAFDTGEIFETYNPTGGLLCKDGNQGSGKTCSDYKVRFGCSCTDVALYSYHKL